MISFDQLLSAYAAQNEGRHKVFAPPEWSQGRTLYGGMSAALCQVAAEAVLGDAKLPLRSGMFCFVGPAGGNLTGEADMLRRGKSTAIVEATLRTEQGIGTRAILALGAGRESQISQSEIPMPDVPAPLDCPWLWGREPDRENIESFPANFHFRRAGGLPPLQKADRGELLLWVRHHKPANTHPMAALLAIADAPPPASVTMFSEWGPISTMTWSVEVLQTDIDVRDNWFLIRTVAEHTENGYSSQKMYIWDETGRPVIAARQNVTIFV